MKHNKVIQIVDWEIMQTYKKKNPPWIKVERDLLRDYRFEQLSDRNKLILLLLNLLASQLDNKIPFDVRYINKNLPLLKSLSGNNIEELVAAGYLRLIDSGSLALTEELFAPETEKSRVEKRKEAYNGDFIAFWDAYPKKIGKAAAYRSFLKAAFPSLEVLLASITRQKDTDAWTKDGGQFIPHPTTWLNQGRWDDEVVTKEDEFQDSLPDADDPYLDEVFGKEAV